MLRVAEVIDGKTLRLTRGWHGGTQPYTLVARLRGVDAPELAQPGGAAARRYLASVARIGARALIWAGDSARDRHDRAIAVVRVEALADVPVRTTSTAAMDIDGNDDDAAPGWVLLQEAMLRSGHAYHYTRYSQNEDYACFEQEARAERRGVWRMPGHSSDSDSDGDGDGAPLYARALGERELPWDYRRRMRELRLRARSPPRSRSVARPYTLEHAMDTSSRMVERAASIAERVRRSAAAAPRHAPHVELFW